MAIIVLNALEQVTLNGSSVRRKATIRFWYQLLSRLDTQALMPLMNYGYAALDPHSPIIPLPAEEEPHRYGLQLYRRVAGAADLPGRSVLEIGCGRGGGAAHLARTLKPATYTGMDFSQRAIAFCQARHQAAHLRFVPGDAEALPFGDAQFDRIINVESSHCYPAFECFIAEVTRVLRPGGLLLYTDWRPATQLEQWRAQITKTGLQIIEDTSITANVLRALDLDHQRKLELIRAHAPKLIERRFAAFAGLRGSPIYRRFQSGELEYRLIVLRKP